MKNTIEVPCNKPNKTGSQSTRLQRKVCNYCASRCTTMCEGCTAVVCSKSSCQQQHTEEDRDVLADKTNMRRFTEGSNKRHKPKNARGTNGVSGPG